MRLWHLYSPVGSVNAIQKKQLCLHTFIYFRLSAAVGQAEQAAVTVKYVVVTGDINKARLT